MPGTDFSKFNKDNIHTFSGSILSVMHNHFWKNYLTFGLYELYFKRTNPTYHYAIYKKNFSNIDSIAFRKAWDGFFKI